MKENNCMDLKRRYDTYAKLALCVFSVSACWFFCMRHGMFGSKVDWISQHSVLPDYFRRQFYETGDLFPEFAANIGGGQNIYNFSYYGLYSPVILLSYLLPFVKMADYMMAAQIVSLAVSGMLLYQWLSGRGVDKKISFCVAVIFLLSGPMVFQSYNQIMFVDYMPFLCMGFLGADRYFEKRKNGLLTVSVFLMIMTSFYFSIGGMIVLGLYGLHRFIGVCEEEYRICSDIQTKKKAVFTLFGKGIHFLASFFTAVLLSGVLLIPTAAALMGRKSTGEGIDWKSLLVPEVSIGRFFYTPYGIGLTTFAITALLSMLFFRRWQESVLAWGCVVILTVPFFAYMMNGGLYVRDKVMIPFLPLLCYVTACYGDWLGSLSQKRKMLWGMLPYGVTLCGLCVHFSRTGLGRWGGFLLADAVVMLLCYGVFVIRKNVLILFLSPIVLLALFGDSYHLQKSKYVSREFYEKVTDSADAKRIKEALEGEEGFYRTQQFGTREENAANLNRIWDMGQYITSIYSSSYNEDYQQFRKEFGAEQPYRNFLMQPALRNPVFQRFMGVKYVVEDGRLWENKAVSPIAYTTDKTMAEKEYKNLGFPENQLALLDYAVVKKDGSDGKNEKEKKDYQNVVSVLVSLPEEINSKKDEAVNITIPNPLVLEEAKNSSAQHVLFLRFHVENLRPSEDIAAWLEGQCNKLTARSHFYYNDNTVFNYAVPVNKNKRQAELVFGPGHYKVSAAECYLGTLPTKEDAKTLYQSEFIPDKEKTKGNVIAGSITARKESCFITTIPYDENFELFVDGKRTKTEKVNTAFLGCRMKEGEHTVEMIYHAPGMKAGKIVSAVGVLLFCADLRKRRTRVRS